jgi:hypothetical protein
MSLVAKYIQFICRILVKILKSNNFAKIKWLSLGKLEEYRSLITSRHPALDMVFWGGFVPMSIPVSIYGYLWLVAV